jgi:hypothetical protein
MKISMELFDTTVTNQDRILREQALYLVGSLTTEAASLVGELLIQVMFRLIFRYISRYPMISGSLGISARFDPSLELQTRNQRNPKRSIPRRCETATPRRMISPRRSRGEAPGRFPFHPQTTESGPNTHVTVG